MAHPLKSSASSGIERHRAGSSDIERDRRKGNETAMRRVGDTATSWPKGLARSILFPIPLDAARSRSIPLDLARCLVPLGVARSRSIPTILSIPSFRRRSSLPRRANSPLARCRSMSLAINVSSYPPTFPAYMAAGSRFNSLIQHTRRQERITYDELKKSFGTNWTGVGGIFSRALPIQPWTSWGCNFRIARVGAFSHSFSG